VPKKRNIADPKRWAHFRFAVIGHLLASPPKRGELKYTLKLLAMKKWTHPVTKEEVYFGASTLERWYYAARVLQNPVDGLNRKRRVDAGVPVKMTVELRKAVSALYDAHKSWSYEIHYDNLLALAEMHSELGEVPSYKTVCRFMQKQGLTKRRRLTNRHTAGAEAAEARLAEREVRSYEVENVNALWHWDAKHATRDVLTLEGLITPVLLAIIDDHSRLVCHAQWYLSETAENVAHCLMQAMQKRGLPRSAMSDNGTPMVAAEITTGLADLGVKHETTLPYSPYQNGKIERLWRQVNERLLPNLDGVSDLTLAFLNEVTQAWIEDEYNCKLHDEIADTPMNRFLAGSKTKDGQRVFRPCPDTAVLKFAFTRADARVQRRTDGTIQINNTSFEVPNRFRHFNEIQVRYASWDLSRVHMIDGETGVVLDRLFPLNKAANADGMRRSLEPVSNAAAPDLPPGLSPRLVLMLRRRATQGLPPAYITKDENK